MREANRIYGFTEKLEKAINDSNLTLTEICERSRISRHMLWEYRYYAIIPSCLVLARLATTLNVSTDYLLGISRMKEIAR